MVKMFFKVVMVGLISSLGMVLALSSSNAGIVYAKPNSVATVKLEVQNAKNVLFNRKGITTFKLSNPFGNSIVLGLPEGVKDAVDPEVYYSSIKPLEFKINIPKTAKAGIYPLKLEVDFYLCDTNIRVCYKETALAKAELRVGQVGSNMPIVMKLEHGGLQIR
jgi:hypothetical protein